MNDLILTFDLDEGTIVLNQGIIKTLGAPKHVQISINDQTCQLMLRACDIEEDQAIVVEKEEMPQVGGRRLLKRISNLAGWTGQESRFVYGYTVPHLDSVVLFDLKDARPISDLPEYCE